MFSEIYDFWQDNQPLWFNSTHADDLKISTNFFPTFQYLEQTTINKETDFTKCKEWIGYVIFYDQIRKHINRVSKVQIELPDDFINDCYTKYNVFKHELTDFEFMFGLMPLRHTHCLTHVKFVTNESWERLEQTKSPDIKRYLTATYERYAKLCLNRDADNLLCFGQHDIISEQEPGQTQHQNMSNDFNSEIFTILDDKCKNHIVNKLIRIDDHSHLITTMYNFIKKHKLQNECITISLSGGVDSMVCSYLLWHIGQPFQAVHINYLNRDPTICQLEEDLVKYWCKMLNIPLYIRRITEINRPKCMAYEMRAIYESYTRDIRFYTYTNAAIGAISYTMLGHNMDDTIENILTNMAAMGHYENLCGMTEYSIQNHYGRHIHFLRPMLQITKDDIYNFAELANIPHLVDSTPKWSQRGKIRDIVRPALELWEPNIIRGFLGLSDKLTQLTQLIDLLIPDKSEQIPDFKNINCVPLNNIYWEHIFKKRGLLVTKKTLTCWTEKLQYLQNNPNKLIINQPIKFVICKNTIVSIVKTFSNVKILIS